MFNLNIRPALIKREQPCCSQRSGRGGTFDRPVYRAGTDRRHLEYPFSCALLGIGTFEQAEMAFAKEYAPIHFSFEEVMERLRHSFEPIACDRCQKCVCPYGHEIHTAFRQYNYYCLGKEFWAIKKLKMDLEQAYRHCRSCTEQPCMKECGRHLYIPEEMERIHKLLEAYG